MGQQQLLLIVLGMVIVGVAIVVGINLYRGYAVDTKRNSVINECVNLAAQAQQYYLKPSTLGGGSNTFDNWKIPLELVNTQNGNYIATVTSSKIEIVGTGNEVVTGTDSVKVKIEIFPNTYKITIIN